MIATERSTNKTVAESTTCIVATEPQKTCIIATDIVTCLIATESVSYIVTIDTATCRIGHIQKLSLAEMVPVRDYFSYNKEIEQMSRAQLKISILFVSVILPYTLNFIENKKMWLASIFGASLS